MTRVVTSQSNKVYVTSGGKAIVSTKNITSLSVTPSTSAQTITAPSGTNGYNPISVDAVTASIDANIQAGNIKKDVQILGVTGTYEGGSTPTKKYNLLDKVKDDNNIEIGIVSGFFYDNNNVEYAVICLYSRYRLSSAKWLSVRQAITNLQNYTDKSLYSTKETATSNCDKILAYCQANSVTSEAVSHCRNQSFNIGGVNYKGQLPNIVELIDIFRNRVYINNEDTTSGQSLSTTNQDWSSNQYSANYAWHLYSSGAVRYSEYKNNTAIVNPVLEIPNVL